VNILSLFGSNVPVARVEASSSAFFSRARSVV